MNRNQLVVKSPQGVKVIENHRNLSLFNACEGAVFLWFSRRVFDLKVGGSCLVFAVAVVPLDKKLYSTLSLFTQT